MSIANGTDNNMSSTAIPKVIVIMGPSGTGKTQFINLISGHHLAVGDQLSAHTTDPSSVNFMLDRQPVVLVDMPAFDETGENKNDEKISDYLKNMRKNKQNLVGVIYMHRITDVRINTTTKESFEALCRICGDRAMKHITIVTNLWGLIQRDIGEAREKELRSVNNCYRPAIEKGANVLRHEGTAESARRILQKVLEKDTVVLRCQKYNIE